MSTPSVSSYLPSGNWFDPNQNYSGTDQSNWYGSDPNANGQSGCSSYSNGFFGAAAFPIYQMPPVQCPWPQYGGGYSYPQQPSAQPLNLGLNLSDLLNQSQLAAPAPQSNNGDNSSMMMMMLMLLLMGGLGNNNNTSSSNTSGSSTGSSSGSSTSNCVVQSPLVLDLAGNGIGTSNRKTNFDIAGDGQASSINDLSAGEGVLTLGNGSNGKQLLGNNTDLTQFGGGQGFANGFAALGSLASIAAAKGQFTQAELTDLHNGKLDAGALNVLEQQYGLGIKVGGFNNTAESLAAAGVNEINLPAANQAGNTITNFDGRNNNLQTANGATFVRSNGTTGNYADLWLNTANQ